MKFFRLDLLTLLISLFILNSCKNKDTIGLTVTSATQLNGSLIDTSTIVVNTDTIGPIATSGLSKTPLGYFNDPLFGPSQSDIAVGLNLPGSTAYTLPSGNIAIDSAVLVLKYADGFYGDSLTSKYKVNVYQIGERVLGKTYYSDKIWPLLSNTPIGSRTFYARTHDSISIYNIITGQPDTLIKVKPQLRIPISKDYINNILFNAGSAQLASNTVFQNNVKGLYISLDKTGITGPGGTLMFGLTDSLNVYYRTTNGTTIDTAQVSLPLGSHAAAITRTPSAALTNVLANKSTSNNLMYLQGLAGTKVKIKFPFLKNMLDTIGNIVINRAELVVTPAPGTTIPFRAQPKLTLYRYDIANQIVELPDATSSDPRSGGATTFGGYYNATLNSYHFIVTAYVQDLMNSKTVDYGTYLTTVDTTNKSTVDINHTIQTAGRVVAVGTDKNSPYRIKLNIIYTKISK